MLNKATLYPFVFLYPPLTLVGTIVSDRVRVMCHSFLWMQCIILLTLAVAVLWRDNGHYRVNASPVVCKLGEQ